MNDEPQKPKTPVTLWWALWGLAAAVGMFVLGAILGGAGHGPFVEFALGLWQLSGIVAVGAIVTLIVSLVILIRRRVAGN